VTSTDTGLKLIDLEVRADIYDRATARLAVLRKYERSQYGVAKTDLTDVGRAALTNWSPPPPSANAGRRNPLVVIEPVESGGFRARCTICEANWFGDMRKDARSASRGHARDAHMSTFRFSMRRDTYAHIKANIHSTGLSVAQVVQDGLEAFADHAHN
jgi:hypothetical protein